MKCWRGLSLAVMFLLASCATVAGRSTDATRVSTRAAAPEARIVAGVFPFLPASQIDEIYGPLVLEMGRFLGISVQLRTASSFEKFSDSLAAGQFDIAVVQPFDYPSLVDTGYQPIARVDLPLSATVVASADLELERPGLAGIASLRIGIPPEPSAMRRLLDAALIAEGLNPATLDIRTFSTHTECLGQLGLDGIDVCAVAPLPLQVFGETTNLTLQIVAVTETVESIAFVANPEFDPDVTLHIQTFLLGLDEDPDTQFLLDLRGIPRYVPIAQGDYERVRELLLLEPSE